MSVKRIIELVKQFSNSEIDNIASHEFHALISPILFDEDEEFEHQYQHLMQALDKEDPNLKEVLLVMLTFFAERKEFLIKKIPLGHDLSYPTHPIQTDIVYSCLCAIPILFDVTKENPQKFSMHEILSQSYPFLDSYTLILCDSLVSYDLLKLNPRELSLLHESIFKDEAFMPEYYSEPSMLAKTIMSLDKPSVFEHASPAHLTSVKFIIGVLVSNVPFENESYLFELTPDLQRLQNEIQQKFSKEFNTRSTVLPLNYLTDSFKIGLLSQVKTNVIRNINAFKKSIDSLDTIDVTLDANIDTQQIDVTAQLSGIPLLMFSSPLFEPSLTITENLEELASFFRRQGFKNINY